MAGLRGATPDRSTLFRISRGDDPWAWPTSGRFDSRWEDPRHEYGVLYAAEQRIAAFVEVLAPFRPVETLRIQLDAVEPRDSRDVPPGVLPASWTRPRTIGMAVVTGAFADITHSDSIAYLREELSTVIDALDLPDITAAVLKGDNRDFTRAVSRHVYELTTDGRPTFAGIRYRSKHGDNFDLWAVFEREGSSNLFRVGRAEAISAEDHQLLEACALLGIRLDSEY